MMVYIDESGDPGQPSRVGASRYFVVAAVAVERGVADRISERIDRLRLELGFRPWQEFRFNKLDRERRLRFLRAIDPFEYAYYVAVVDKAQMAGEASFTKEEVYIRATGLALAAIDDVLRPATVVIDGTGSRPFRKSLSTMLRARLNQHRRAIDLIRMEESHRSNLLQVADMVVGAVARSLGNKGDAWEYRHTAQRHEQAVLWSR